VKEESGVFIDDKPNRQPAANQDQVATSYLFLYRMYASYVKNPATLAGFFCCISLYFPIFYFF
tara:strand:+ start:2178 stop:2366 length:189 start_codon:yes stop_codon:yes gene_type:complete